LHRGGIVPFLCEAFPALGLNNTFFVGRLTFEGVVDLDHHERGGERLVVVSEEEVDVDGDGGEVGGLVVVDVVLVVGDGVDESWGGEKVVVVLLVLVVLVELVVVLEELTMVVGLVVVEAVVVMVVVVVMTVGEVMVVEVDEGVVERSVQPVVVDEEVKVEVDEEGLRDEGEVGEGRRVEGENEMGEGDKVEVGGSAEGERTKGLLTFGSACDGQKKL